MIGKISSMSVPGGNQADGSAPALNGTSMKNENFPINQKNYVGDFRSIATCSEVLGQPQYMPFDRFGTFETLELSTKMTFKRSRWQDFSICYILRIRTSDTFQGTSGSHLGTRDRVRSNELKNT